MLVGVGVLVLVLVSVSVFFLSFVLGVEIKRRESERPLRPPRLDG